MGAIGISNPLLTGPEQRLYGRLVRAFPGHVVLAKVATSRLLPADQIAAGDGADNPRWARRAVADFVICNADFSVLAVIQVGRRREPIEGAAALESAGLKVISVPLDDIPQEAALRALVAALPARSPGARSLRRAS